MYRSILISFLCIVCAIPVISQTNDQIKENNQITTENKASVYLFRKSMKYPMQPLFVDINKIRIAALLPNKFIKCDLNAGTYCFSANGLNSDSIALNLEKGKEYYIEVMPKLGLIITRCKLELTDPLDGAQKVKTCDLIEVKKEALESLNSTMMTR